MWRYCRSQHYVKWYTYPVDIELISNVHSVTVVLQSVCICTYSSHILPYNCAYILNPEDNSLYHKYTEPSCCSSSSRLCARAHYEIISHLYIYMCVFILFFNAGLYRVQFYLFSKRTCLSLVMQTVASVVLIWCMCFLSVFAVCSLFRNGGFLMRRVEACVVYVSVSSNHMVKCGCYTCIYIATVTLP